MDVKLLRPVLRDFLNTTNTDSSVLVREVTNPKGQYSPMAQNY